MRNLASSLTWWSFAVLLAFAVVIAAAMGLLALRPAPRPVQLAALSTVADQAIQPGASAALEMPALLGPLPTFARPVEAAMRLGSPISEYGSVSIRVVGTSTAERGLVVCVLDGRTGVVLRSAPCENDQSLTLLGIPAGSHWVVAAGSLDEVRHSYFTRSKVTVTGNQQASVELDARSADLIVLLPWGSSLKECAVTRAEDDRWLPAFHSGSVIDSPQRLPASRTSSQVASPPTRVRFHKLGFGEYRVRLRGMDREVAVHHSRPGEVDLR